MSRTISNILSIEHCAEILIRNFSKLARNAQKKKQLLQGIETCFANSIFRTDYCSDAPHFDVYLTDLDGTKLNGENEEGR